MCMALITYDCGHALNLPIHCKRSRNIKTDSKRELFGNQVKYWLTEEPCRYNEPKRRHRLCNACLSNLETLNDYTASCDGEGDEQSNGSYRDYRDDTSDRSRKKRSKTSRSFDKHSTSKSISKESHTSRSAHTHKSSREKRGRSHYPRSPMATIDESTALAPRPSCPVGADSDSGDIADAFRTRPQSIRSETSVNELQGFKCAAERAEGEQNKTRGFRVPSPEPVSPLSPLVSQDSSPRPPSSVYQAPRAQWQAQAMPRQENTKWRSASSVYSESARKHSTPQPAPPQQNTGWRPPSSIYSQPSTKFSTHRSHLAVPATPSRYQGSDLSWVSESVHSLSEEADSSAQASVPSKDTTPQKSTPRKKLFDSSPRLEDGPWLQDPYERACKDIANDARRQLEKEASEKADKGNGKAREQDLKDSIPRDQFDPQATTDRLNASYNAYGSPNPYEGEYSRHPSERHPCYFDESSDGEYGSESSLYAAAFKTEQPKLAADPPQFAEPKPDMMHFTCYRDPNNPKPPPAPTPSSVGSQVYQNPRSAPVPPSLKGSLPIPHPGLNSHKLARQDVDNISNITRWSDFYPPDINTNIQVKANARTSATHNGRPVHVVDPNIVKKSWGDANGPSAGKVSQRAVKKEKKPSWWSRLMPDYASDKSFGCVDAKKHDSLNSQHRPDLKKSNRNSKKTDKSSNSKSKKK